MTCRPKTAGIQSYYPVNVRHFSLDIHAFKTMNLYDRNSSRNSMMTFRLLEAIKHQDVLVN